VAASLKPVALRLSTVGQANTRLGITLTLDNPDVLPQTANGGIHIDTYLIDLLGPRCISLRSARAWE
jgi:hypothetical protein